MARRPRRSRTPAFKAKVALAAVVHWSSRKVLAWRLSIAMDTAFCIETVEEALPRFGKPEIFNPDQGSQFTSRNNVFAVAAFRVVERLWTSVKDKEVCLRAYASVSEASSGAGPANARPALLALQIKELLATDGDLRQEITWRLRFA